MTQRIALYGGSFDPIHNGHLIIARAVAETLNVHRVVFLPSARPPHKNADDLAAAEHREAMVRIAIRDEPVFELSDHDLRESGPTYTIDTIAHFTKSENSDARPYWIIGADSLAELTTWHRAAELIDRCEIVTAARPGWDDSVVASLRSAFTSEQVDRLLAHVLKTPQIDISATDIRGRIRAGLSIRYLVPDSVHTYIVEHGFYRDESNG